MAGALKGSVGEGGKNDPGDVKQLRTMLKARGFNVPDGDKVDAGLLKAIVNVKAKAGDKSGGKLVEPGSAVVKFLTTKPRKAYQVTYKNRTVEVSEADYKAVREDIFKRLERYIDSLISTTKLNSDITLDYERRAEASNGLLDAATQFIIIKAGRVTMPRKDLRMAALKATGELARAKSGRDLKLLHTALPAAERAINAFSADVQRFLKEFTGTAGNFATALEITSATCFAIVGAMAAPVLVGATGMSAAAATTAAGGGVAFLQSASKELGAVASGEKFDAWTSAKNIGLDTTVGLITAGLGNKIPMGKLQVIAGKVAKPLAAQFGVSAVAMEAFLIKFFQSTGGQEAVKTAFGEAVTMVGNMVKTGKVPDGKAFEDAATKVLISLLTAGVLKNFEGFTKKWAMESRTVLQKRLLPDIMKKLLKKNDLPPVLTAKLHADLWNALGKQIVETGTGAVLGKVKDGFGTKEMTDTATKQIESDARLRKMIEAEVEKFLKKNKVGV